MASVDVFDWNKKKVGSVDLPATVFETEVRKDLLHTYVRWQLASRRQGTHMAQTRSMVNGSSAKPFKQKGTGNARQGNKRSPLLRGGAVTFGPQPRDYSYKLPRKLKKKALKSALSYLAKEGKLQIVEDMKSEGKTKELAARLKAFGAEKALLIDAQKDDMFMRASRNLNKFKYNTVEGLNVFDLLKYDMAILTKDSINSIVKRCGEEA